MKYERLFGSTKQPKPYYFLHLLPRQSGDQVFDLGCCSGRLRNPPPLQGQQVRQPDRLICGAGRTGHASAGEGGCS